jgi:hypothetical protein
VNAVTPTRRALAAGGLVEMINLKIIRPDFAIASVRLREVHLRNLTVKKLPDGRLLVRPPKILSRNGEVDYGPAFQLQPGVRETIEVALADLWARAEAVDGEG